MLCLCAAALSFMACSNDDDEGGVPNAGVIPSVADPLSRPLKPRGAIQNIMSMTSRAAL